MTYGEVVTTTFVDFYNLTQDHVVWTFTNIQHAPYIQLWQFVTNY